MKEKIPTNLAELKEKYSRMELDKEYNRIVDELLQDFKEIVLLKIRGRRHNQKAIVQPEECDKLESQVRVLKDHIGGESE